MTDFKGNAKETARIKKAHYNGTLKGLGEESLRRFLTLNGSMDIAPLIPELTTNELIENVSDILESSEEQTEQENTMDSNKANTMEFERAGKTYRYIPGSDVSLEKFMEKKSQADMGALRGALPKGFEALVVVANNPSTSVKPVANSAKSSVVYKPFELKYGDNSITINSKGMLEKALKALDNAGIEPDPYVNPNVGQNNNDPLASLKDGDGDPLSDLKDDSKPEKHDIYSEIREHIMAQKKMESKDRQAWLKSLNKLEELGVKMLDNAYDDIPEIEDISLSGAERIMYSVFNFNASHPVKAEFLLKKGVEPLAVWTGRKFYILMPKAAK